MIKVMTQACSSKTKTWFTGEWQAGRPVGSDRSGGANVLLISTSHVNIDHFMIMEWQSFYKLPVLLL